MKKRTKKLLVLSTGAVAKPVAQTTSVLVTKLPALSTVMAAKAAIHALRATTPNVPTNPARATCTAEGNKSFFASFCSQKEVAYLPKAAP